MPDLNVDAYPTAPNLDIPRIANSLINEALNAPRIPQWRLQGACTQTDPELFFGGDPYGRNDIRIARGICAACPVRANCLTDALGRTYRDDNDGVFGGLLPSERHLLRKAFQKALKATTAT